MTSLISTAQELFFSPSLCLCLCLDRVVHCFSDSFVSSISSFHCLSLPFFPSCSSSSFFLLPPPSSPSSCPLGGLMSIASHLASARSAAAAGDDAAVRSRNAAAADMYALAADEFEACCKYVDDEGTVALFMEMAASCRELAKLQKHIASLQSTGATTARAEAEQPKTDETAILQERLRLLEQKNKLLQNQQFLLLDICCRLALAKEHQEHNAASLRRLLFDQVTSAPTAPSPIEASETARIERLRQIFTQRTKQNQSMKDLAASLIQSHFVSQDELVEYTQEAKHVTSYTGSAEIPGVESVDTGMLSSVALLRKGGSNP
eukprot:m.103653 g.103653  ORF g.103653 m.103653 type:complete len:320 (-) comp15051_c0_seq9:28-987(-)